jgi:hypothetical protein
MSSVCTCHARVRLEENSEFSQKIWGKDCFGDMGIKKTRKLNGTCGI